jgi:squalene-associated FAD-dependent desaturase
MESDDVRMRIGIVGGGWAGFAAAVELTRAGHTVTVYEAGKVLGGRARRMAADGPPLDNGQHLLAGAYSETLRLMEAVSPGSSVSGFLRLPLALVYPDGVSIRAPHLPAPLHLAAALLFARGLSLPEKLSAISFMRALKKINFQPTPDRTVAEALANQPESVRKYLWEPICVAALNTPIEQASFRVFARVLKDALTGKAANSDFLIPARDLSALFPEPAAAWLERNGGELRMRTRIAALQRSGTQWKVLWDGGEAVHDRIIVATAPAHAIDLLSPLNDCQKLVHQLGNYSYQPILTVYAEYPTLPKLPAPLIGWVEPVPLFIFDMQASLGMANTISVVASASGPHLEWDDARWVEEISARMRQVFGPLPKPRLVKRITEKRATFACTPDLFRPVAKTPCSGLFLAGDYVDGPYPATLEGAVRSGVQCAQTLLATP